MRSVEEQSRVDPMHDIKGRIAEALIEQLFRALGWKAMRFGMEQTHPHLIDSVAGRDDVVSRAVRSQPDFIVQKDDGQPFFVEVKYRASGNFKKADLRHSYPPTTFLVLVSPYRIQCVTMSDLDNGVELVRERSEHWFADRKEFRADTNVVMKFIELARKLFQFDAVA